VNLKIYLFASASHCFTAKKSKFNAGWKKGKRERNNFKDSELDLEVGNKGRRECRLLGTAIPVSPH
jgi:hypothetical protein